MAEICMTYRDVLLITHLCCSSPAVVLILALWPAPTLAHTSKSIVLVLFPRLWLLSPALMPWPSLFSPHRSFLVTGPRSCLPPSFILPYFFSCSSTLDLVSFPLCGRPHACRHSVLAGLISITHLHLITLSDCSAQVLSTLPATESHCNLQSVTACGCRGST